MLQVAALDDTWTLYVWHEATPDLHPCTCKRDRKGADALLTTVTVQVAALDDTWTLYVWREDEQWDPEWKWPIVAVVIIVSVIMAVLAGLILVRGWSGVGWPHLSVHGFGGGHTAVGPRVEVAHRGRQLSPLSPSSLPLSHCLCHHGSPGGAHSGGWGW